MAGGCGIATIRVRDFAAGIGCACLAAGFLTLGWAVTARFSAGFATTGRFAADCLTADCVAVEVFDLVSVAAARFATGFAVPAAAF
jgi:hypothetical protein